MQDMGDPLHDPFKKRRIANVAADELEHRMHGQIRHPPGSEVVDHTDPLSFRKKEIDGRRSDDPRPTGDKDEGRTGRRCRHETTPRGSAGRRRPPPDPAARVPGATRGRKPGGVPVPRLGADRRQRPSDPSSHRVDEAGRGSSHHPPGGGRPRREDRGGPCR